MESPDGLWRAIDGLLDRALDEGQATSASVDALARHRVHVLAAERLRAREVPVPAALRTRERVAAICALAAPHVLERVRDACDGPLLLMKGPELAAVYERPSTRGFVDLDLLSPEPLAVQAALLEAGFQVVPGGPDDPNLHHGAPLRWPGLPLAVEIHRRPHWLQDLPAPVAEELFVRASPSRVPVAGILAPAPEHHALLVAVHAWTHAPLGHLGHLIDVAALAARADGAAITATARRWGCGRVWRTTSAAIEATFFHARRPATTRLWAGHLSETRDQSALEAQLQRSLAPLWGLPPALALRAATVATAYDTLAVINPRWSDAVRARRNRAHARAASPHDPLAPLIAGRR